MAQFGVLNALITSQRNKQPDQNNDHKQTQLTKSQQFSATLQLNSTNPNPNPNSKPISNNQNNPKSSRQLANHWHWIHYHNPYNFGSKLPQFNDYDANEPSTDSWNGQLNGSPPTSALDQSDLAAYMDTELNWFPFGNKTKSSAGFNRIVQHQSRFHQPEPTIAGNSLQPKLQPQKPFQIQLHLPTQTNNRKQLNSFDHLAQLSCDSGEMIIRLNFSEPFKGIVYPDHNRLSPCRFFGDGHHNYELRLPLRGCGTRQVSLMRDPKLK